MFWWRRYPRDHFPARSGGSRGDPHRVRTRSPGRRPRTLLGRCRV